MSRDTVHPDTQPPPPRPRDVRRLAMQTLYTIDATNLTDEPALREALDEPFDDGDAAPPESAKEPAIELAAAAWSRHAAADAAVAELAPDWPTHRQPPVDRAILRLAYHELAVGLTPPRVVINEAIELAKQFSNEHAPPFINGVLDKLAKRLAQHPESRDAATHPVTSDDWLKDALQP